MSGPPSSPNPREAALLAAQRRLAQVGPAQTSTEAGTPSAPTKTAWTRPEAGSKEEKDWKYKFARVLDKDVVGGNNYQSSATCIETLLQIAKNIQEHPDEPKYRSLKASNKVLQTKVFAVRGGRDLFRLLGFRTVTEEFIEQWKFDPTPKRMWEMEMGMVILRDHLELAQSRAQGAQSSQILDKHADAERKARALAQIEADRARVKERAERERIAREAREAEAAAAAAAKAEADAAAAAEEAKRREAEGLNDEQEDEGSLGGSMSGPGRRLDGAPEMTSGTADVPMADDRVEQSEAGNGGDDEGKAGGSGEAGPSSAKADPAAAGPSTSPKRDKSDTQDNADEPPKRRHRSHRPKKDISTDMLEAMLKASNMSIMGVGSSGMDRLINRAAPPPPPVRAFTGAGNRLGSEDEPAPESAPAQPAPISPPPAQAPRPAVRGASSAGMDALIQGMAAGGGGSRGPCKCAKCRAQPFRTPGYRLGGEEENQEPTATAPESSTTAPEGSNDPSASSPAATQAAPARVVGASPTAMNAMVEGLLGMYGLRQPTAQASAPAVEPAGEAPGRMTAEAGEQQPASAATKQEQDKQKPDDEA